MSSSSSSSSSGGEEATGGEETDVAGERITGIGVGGGANELTYEGVDSEELEPWGPAGYVVDHRGLNWLADGPGHKVLVLDDEGTIVDRYELDGLVHGLADIEVTETHLYLLMVGGDAPVVARIGRHDAASTPWEAFPVAMSGFEGWEVTGLRKDAAGTVSLELALGRAHVPLFAADGTAIAEPGMPVTSVQVAGRSVELIGYEGDPQGNPSRGSIVVDGVEVAVVETMGMLGGFSLIGSTDDDHIWIRVADVGLVDGSLRTRSLAYRFTLDGGLVQLVELPMRDEIVWVEHRIAMEPEGGNLRVLSSGAEEVSLRRPKEIGLVGRPPAEFEPFLPIGGGVADAQGEGARNGCAISRAEIMLRAYEYANYEAVYNSAHMKTCSGRTPVTYFEQRLGQPIRGVAYKYAGHMEVSTYDNAVANNYTVGDLNTKTDKKVDSCSYGVDCSGFVSKVWRSGHYTTSSLNQVSFVLDNTDQLRPGDALNSPGSHVRLVAENLWAYGVKVVESTAGQERMRVVVRNISWENAGYGAGYKPIRYNKVCPDAPPPPPPRTTHVLFDLSGYIPSSSGYTPIAPVRLLDTRQPGQEHVGPLAEDQTISVSIAGRSGIPEAGAIGAVVLNVTATDTQEAGHLAVYPDPPLPGTSTVNFTKGEVVPNLVLIDPGADGKIEIRHKTGPGGGSNILVDAFGWFPVGADIHMLTPARVFDSRQVEFGAAKLPSGPHDLKLAGVGGIPLGGVGAVIANIAVLEPDANGYATIYEAGTPRPTTSNLNYTTGGLRANLVIIPVSKGGYATLYTHSSAHYLVDVLGWFGGGADFQPLPPIRLRDTRTDDAEPVGDGESISVDVISAPMVPGQVKAVFGNLTAVQPTAPGYLQAYAGAAPATSNVNFLGGKDSANAVIAEVAGTGEIHILARIPAAP